MADYNGGGFDENHGMVFGSPDGAADGSRDDYDKWDWKQIQAAIVGQASGTPNGDDLARARGVADPQSLADASRVFFEVQQVLEGVSKALTDQANALAGDKGPWRGDAAQSFVNMMTTFSRQVRANADVLSGGSTGLNSVPKQLANNAVALNNAQNLILRINSWYAQEALLQGAATGPDGAVSVSQKPKIVEMMTADMRAVLKSLASDYSVTVDNIATPTPVTVSVNGGDGPGLGGGDGLDGGLGGDPGGGGDIPGLGGDAGLGSDGGGLGPDPQSLAALAGTPDTGGLDSGLDPGGAGGGLDGLGDPAPFPGDTSDLGGGTDGLGLGGDAGIGGGDFDPSGLDNLINPSPFPGLGGLGSGGGLGAGDEAFDGVSAGDPAAFGDTGLGVGAAGGLGDGLGSGLDDGLGSGLGDGLGSGLGDGLGVGEGAAQPATSAGYPYMPGMGGMGGGSAAGAGLSSEPSDASGLLDPSTEPWEGDTSVGDGEVGSELGAAAGGEGLGTAAGAEGQGAAGMPYLPGMGGMGGATGGRDAAAERSDASGLLEPDTEPWEPEETSESEEVGSPEGVLPGVPFLLGFGEAGPVSRPDTARRGTESGAPAEAEATADETAETAETATATSGAPVMIGSDGLPVAGKEVGDGDAADGGADNGGADGGAVVARPLPGDGEEDFSAWETAAGAAAFVPLLWTLPRQGRTEPGADEDEERLAHEPRGTWQPERNAAESAPSPDAVAPFVSFDDSPAEEPEEAGDGPEEETEESSRGIADLLVQEEGAWGSVPGGAGPSL